MKMYDFGVKPTSVKEYNTNNAWGFGGGRGLLYSFSPDLYAKIGVASTRHMGTFPYITIYHNGNKVFDETDTPKNRARAAETIRKLAGVRENFTSTSSMGAMDTGIMPMQGYHKPGVVRKKKKFKKKFRLKEFIQSKADELLPSP